MPDYRRNYLPGGTFFFTVVTHGRRPILTTEAGRAILSEAILACRAEFPFAMAAIALLPEHLHAIWTLPRGDTNYSVRWGRIKALFTKRWLAQGASEAAQSASRVAERRRGVWQRRFWEHTIRDELDFERHLDYIHYNPVKHKLVTCPSHWRWSSFHRWVKLGQYEANWACGDQKLKPIAFDDIATTTGE